MLRFIVEGLSALEGQVEAAPVDQGHLQVFPKLDDPRQQGLHTTPALIRTSQNCIAMVHAASCARGFLGIEGQLLWTRGT